MNMSNLTPATVTQTLSTIGKEIDELTARLVEAEAGFLEARRKHRKAYALAFLNFKMGEDAKPYTIAEREHLSYLATEDTLLAFETAEYKVTVCKDELRAKRDRMEIGRSLSAVMRTEWSAS
jgi:hypothetical protein